MSNSAESKVDEYLHRLKNRPVLAVIVVIAVVIITLGQITGSLAEIAGFVSRLGNGQQTLSVEYVVKNERAEAVHLEPYSQVHIAPPTAVWRSQEPYRRLLLQNRSSNSTSRYEIRAGGRQAYFAELSISREEAELLARGTADIHFVIELENSDLGYSIGLPFHESEFNDRLLLQYTIPKTDSR